MLHLEARSGYVVVFALMMLIEFAPAMLLANFQSNRVPSDLVKLVTTVRKSGYAAICRSRRWGRGGRSTNAVVLAFLNQLRGAIAKTAA